MLRFLKAQLSKQYEVLEAVNGNQAVEKGRQYLPDLVLLDMMMPEKDGIEACRELKGQVGTCSMSTTAKSNPASAIASIISGRATFTNGPSCARLLDMADISLSPTGPASTLGPANEVFLPTRIQDECRNGYRPVGLAHGIRAKQERPSTAGQIALSGLSKRSVEANADGRATRHLGAERVWLIARREVRRKIRRNPKRHAEAGAPIDLQLMEKRRIGIRHRIGGRAAGRQGRNPLARIGFSIRPAKR